MNVIFGASGHAREIACFVSDTGEVIDYFVADEIGHMSVWGIQVVSEQVFFKLAAQREEVINVFIAIGNSGTRKKVYANLKEQLSNITFPNLFSRNAIIGLKGSSIKLGEGNIFYPGVTLTADIVVGDHNHFNLNSSISHDCRFGNFNTISPRVSIAGNVLVGDENFFGVGVSVIDNIEIGNRLIIGAGSTVICNLPEAGTYVGTPSRKIK